MKRILGLSLLLTMAVGISAAPVSLGKRYKDESNGFSIRIPSKWEQVPTKFQETTVIGKWSGKPKRGYAPPSSFVLRFLNRVEEEEPATPAEALRRGIPGYAGLYRSQPKDVFAWAQRRYFGFMKAEVVEDLPEFKMSRKGLQARVRIMKQTLRRGGGGRDADKQLAMVIAAQISTVEESDSDYGLVYSFTIADEKHMKRSFLNAIKGFRILEPDEDDVDEDGGTGDAGIFVDSTKKPEVWRAARKKKLIPGWDALDTENYLIVYNKEVKRPLLKKIAAHIEAIRADVYEKLFPPARDIKAISVVRVCKDRAEYHRYGGPGGSAGYWSRGDEELVFYQDKSNKKDSLRVLYHEAFHQYIHYAVGDVAPHSWFNEGHGDYFAGHNYVGKKFVAKPFRWRTGIIANALSQKTYVPLRKFLKYTQGEYYANPGLCYAQGWSFVYFLREVERRKITKYKKYWGLLDAYFEGIKANVKSVKENALEGLPPEPQPDAEKDKPAKPGLPRLPGLERPFPGENPEAGASGAGGNASGGGGGRTTAGPRITGTKSALDAAVDRVFLKNRKIDIDQLEKDWIAFSK